jgi:hypothetical protein
VNFLNGCAVSTVLFQEVNWTSGVQASSRYLETRRPDTAVFMRRGTHSLESLEQFTYTQRKERRMSWRICDAGRQDPAEDEEEENVLRFVSASVPKGR